MKKAWKLLIVLNILLVSLFFSACDDKDFSVYLFCPSAGGYITLNDSTEEIRFKDILYYDNTTSIKLTAHANEGYEFIHWEVNDRIYSTDSVINLTISDEAKIKAVFSNTAVYTITYQNENGDALLDGGGNPIVEQIRYKEEISSMPAIPTITGKTGKYYCEDVEYSVGDKFMFTTNKIFVLKYTTNQYTVSFSIGENYSFELLNNYNLIVNYNGMVKFKLNLTNPTDTYVVKANGTIINPDASKVYTVNNISRNISITAEHDESNNRTIEVVYNVPNVNNYNLVSSNTLTSSSPIKYKVEVGGIMSFNLTTKTALPTNHVIKVYNGEAEIIGILGQYSISNVQNNIVISIKEYSKLDITIDYGQMGIWDFTDAIEDEDYQPYLYLYVYKLSTLNNTIINENDIVYLDNDYEIEQMTIKNFINHLNTLNTNYKVSRNINILYEGGTVPICWCIITYSSGNTISSLSFDSNSFNASELTGSTLSITFISNN